MKMLLPWSDPKGNLWKPTDERTSDETAILWDGPDSPDVITDLFGNRVKIINTKHKDMEPANILECIRKQIDEHEYLMKP